MSSDPDTPATTAFTGFDIPRQNWFKVPNNWTDITADISSIAELKVVEYVLKHTWGYQEYGMRKRITNDEFMHGRRRKDGTRLDKGTGLSKPSVIAGLKAAVERGLLIEEIDDSDRARVKKYYSLRMMPGLNDEFLKEGDEPSGSPDPGTDGGGVKDLNAGVKNLYPEVKTFYPRGKRSLPRTEQDTLVRHLQEETNTNNNNSGVNPTKSDVVVALSSQEIAEEEQANHPASTTSESFAPAPLNPPAPNSADGKAEAKAALLTMGLAATVTERLVSRHSVERIKEKIEFLRYLQEQTPGRIKNPKGWLRRAIEENYGAPDGYKSTTEREAEAAEKQHQKETFEQAILAQEQRRREEQVQRQQAAAARLADFQKQYGTTQQEVDLWRQVLDEFKLSQAPGTFQAYLADTVLLSLRDGEALIGLPNFWMRDWVENRLAKKIGQTLTQYLDGQKVTPKFIALNQGESAAGG
jgi:hypothetical protein